MPRALPSAGDIRSYLTPFDFFTRYVGSGREGEIYVDVHAQRFRETLAALDDVPDGARVLELGAVPYYLTILVGRHLGAQVDPLSFYEVEQAAHTVHEVTSAATGERHRFDYRALNVERDLFPVAPASYDLVLCCEILEHLLINPSHMLYEAHQALRPGGRLLVTTPNVARWANLAALAEGRNINDRYHGNGMYGRHNREYTLAEVTRLVEACGFAIERAETRDVYPRAGEPGAAAVPGLERLNGHSREDTIFVLARAEGEARMACPDELYVLMDEYRNVLRADVRMGVNEIGQIGSGWYEIEREGQQRCRWSSGRAHVLLSRVPGSALRIAARSHHPDVHARPIVVSAEVNGVHAGEHTIATHDWQDLSFSLDHVSTTDPLHCVLLVDRTWRPSDVSGDDARELGVRVSRIWIE